MSRYPQNIIDKVKLLRSQGKTYGEIQQNIGQKFPKSTLSEWCKNTPLPIDYQKRISRLNLGNLGKARSIAREINKIKREEFFEKISAVNSPIAKKIYDRKVAKIALSMLCLGEASKSDRGSVFCLGNSDHRIITLFINLLKTCFDNFDSSKIRCTVMCRADQDIENLEKYWLGVVNIPKTQFYKTTIDPRTVGKPTKRTNYKGVLRVDYFNSKIQLELESLAQLIYNRVLAGP